MHTATHKMSKEMEQCIQNCLNCHSICEETVSHCLSMGGEHASPSHITLLLDCAQICQTSADFMLRASPWHGLTCGVCAQVCNDCALECERMAHGDQHMLECATICRQCAQSCEAMAHMAA